MLHTEETPSHHLAPLTAQNGGRPHVHSSAPHSPTADWAGEVCCVTTSACALGRVGPRLRSALRSVPSGARAAASCGAGAVSAGLRERDVARRARELWGWAAGGRLPHLNHKRLKRKSDEETAALTCSCLNANGPGGLGLHAGLGSPWLKLSALWRPRRRSRCSHIEQHALLVGL